MKILAHISWAYATLIIFTGLTFSIIMYPILPRPYARKISAWFIRLSTLFSTTIEGNEDPDAQMFLVNHQSDLDICVIETITNKDITWVAKKSLFEVPFFGLAMSMPEDIEVERESKTSLIKLLRAAKDRLKKKRIITMFPEGTRSRGAKMLPFKSGAKVIADQYKLKVQPIVLIETAKCYDIKRFYYVPRNIKVIFLDSFIADKDDQNWLSGLREKMQKVYDHELANNTRNR
ncbi:lysophospholipid acyltransferase family protein [Sulfurimonas autotrophica]|uniref:1-acyl-sn-glycerol-3-phosphate acyltransferase n=1 Tax=Sulfurimonas autotrophica (strain ATCC BAA-671 / DSM 16294 / JCM 11897 / OK10) TaxID=563040 RepID=E0UPF0_SULAO|nr:lysophospholipid acyltransferase family protein [Sulfurimonas autotrophica]ADN09680.1 phospholipid/glycerol acyltransferase [Sulfurimonas autotrophica DSM 16294]